jgi:hypothetical protein
VARRRSHLVRFLLAAMLLLSPAPVWSNPGGQPNGGGNGGGDGSPGKSGDAPGRIKHRKTPTPDVQGDYKVRIVGYYTGTATATATGGGITISGSVTDPSGKKMSLATTNLDVTDDRFTGSGTLDGAAVRIDGRLDPKDQKGNEVLKKARITFTLSANGHHSRGAGDWQRAGAGH